MQGKTQTRQTGSRRGRTYLDPHYFTGFIRRRPQGPRNSQETHVSWMSYPITIDEVLDDLSYGRD